MLVVNESGESPLTAYQMAKGFVLVALIKVGDVSVRCCGLLASDWLSG